MTQYIYEDGRMVPVTVIEAGPCTVTQIRTTDRDGYESAQLGFGSKKKLNKPARGTSEGQRRLPIPARGARRRASMVWKSDSRSAPTCSRPVNASPSSAPPADAASQGTVKRHGFSGGQRTHGQSDRRRAPGSIGMGTTPGRVFKGKKMSGHMGNARITVKNLEVVHVNPERNLLLVKGGVPGAPQGLLMVKKS